jgi:hypothetical protein
MRYRIANIQSQRLRGFTPDTPFDLVRHSGDEIRTLQPEMQKGAIHAYVLVSSNQSRIGAVVGLTRCG